MDILRIIGEVVDASFLKRDEYLKKVGKLQEILQNIDEKSIEESLDRICGLGFTSHLMTYDLAQNIIHLSCTNKAKIPLLVRVVRDLYEQSDIVTRLEELVSFGKQIGARRLFLSLIENNLLDHSHINQFNTENESEDNLQTIIEVDNV